MRHRRSGGFLASGLLVALVAAWTPIGRDVRAQAPAASPPQSGTPEQAKSTAAPGESVASLTAKYRLQERFTTKDEKGESNAVGQYQVGFRETKAPDDPTRQPLVIQAIYTERPAALNPVDDRHVTDLVRHYASVKITPDPWKDRKDRRPNEDLTIWYRSGSTEMPPQVIVLTPKRTLREEEYSFAINYDFVTNFSYLLPERPIRLADSWQVNRAGAIALINDNNVRGGTLNGKLSEIRVHPTLKGMHQAILNIAGRLTTQANNAAGDVLTGDVAVNARVQFAFKPTAPDDGVIDASGAIEKIVLAEVQETRKPGMTKGNGFKRELIFERKRPGPEPLLTIPDPPPSPTQENSWLTHADPKGRYVLRHPQDFELLGSPAGSNTIFFKRVGQDDLMTLEYLDRPQGRPETMLRNRVGEWKDKGIEVLGGVPTKLPDADWPGLSVYYMEAALRGDDASGRAIPRRYSDAYVIQFPRNVAVLVTADTFQDDPIPFRKQVRATLRTLTLGAPKP